MSAAAKTHGRVPAVPHYPTLGSACSASLQLNPIYADNSKDGPRVCPAMQWQAHLCLKDKAKHCWHVLVRRPMTANAKTHCVKANPACLLPSCPCHILTEAGICQSRATFPILSQTYTSRFWHAVLSNLITIGRGHNTSAALHYPCNT
jgi:hypothetical protein